MLDEAMSGEAMALSVIYKINNKLNFLRQKNRFLNPSQRQLLYALIQLHSDYICSAWYLNLTNKLRTNIQTTQNKCMLFCLQLGKMTHVSYKEFNFKLVNRNRKIQSLHYFNPLNTYMYLNTYPNYFSEVFEKVPQNYFQTRCSFKKL